MVGAFGAPQEAMEERMLLHGKETLNALEEYIIW